MSLAVDQYLLDKMKHEDDIDLMLESDISDMVLDHLFGWDEENQSYQMSQGMLFPQPIRRID